MNISLIPDSNIGTMKSFFKMLFFDSEYTKKLKQNKTHKPHLYQLLLDGKITLQEYLSAER